MRCSPRHMAIASGTPLADKDFAQPMLAAGGVLPPPFPCWKAWVSLRISFKRIFSENKYALGKIFAIFLASSSCWRIWSFHVSRSVLLKFQSKYAPLVNYSLHEETSKVHTRCSQLFQPGRQCSDQTPCLDISVEYPSGSWIFSTKLYLTSCNWNILFWPFCRGLFFVGIFDKQISTFMLSYGLFFQFIANLCIRWVRAEVTHVSTWPTTWTLLHSYDCRVLSKILNVLEVEHVWTGMCEGFLQSGHFFIYALNGRSYIGEASAVALIGWVKAGGSLSCVSKECRYLGYRLSHTFWGVILDMWLTNEHKGITERSLVCFWGDTIAETLKRRSWAGETNCCCEQVSKFSRQIIESSVLKWGDDTANWSSTAFSSE